MGSKSAILWSYALKKAREAGLEAGRTCEVQLIAVKGYEHEPFPICGFAWVSIRPATSKFAYWLKKNKHASKSYVGGLQIWIGDHGQSHDRKYAHAQAFAKTLKEELVLTGVEPNLQVSAASRYD